MHKLSIFSIIFLSLFASVKGQNGEVSISTGPILSFIKDNKDLHERLSPGVGLEAVGQYNFSNKSSLLLQTSFASYGSKPKVGNDTAVKYRQTLYSLKVGYQYQFGASGLFINGLGGIEKYSGYDLTNSSFSLGIGKRFSIKGIHFMDVGVDCISRPTDIRFNIKALFCLFRRPKNNMGY